MRVSTTEMRLKGHLNVLHHVGVQFSYTLKLLCWIGNKLARLHYASVGLALFDVVVEREASAFYCRKHDSMVKRKERICLCSVGYVLQPYLIGLCDS